MGLCVYIHRSFDNLGKNISKVDIQLGFVGHQEDTVTVTQVLLSFDGVPGQRSACPAEGVLSNGLEEVFCCHIQF